MAKKWIVLGIVLTFVGFIVFSSGCGQAQTSTTTTTLAAASSVGIKGSTSSSATGMSVGAFAAVGTAEVYIGYCTKDSDAITNLAQGTTDAGGNYEINVSGTSLNALKASNGYVPNLMVIVSKEGIVYGCVIPSISPEVGKVNYAPTANPGDYKKQKIALQAFKKGIDPKGFDFNSEIDQKFSSNTLSGYNDTQIDALAGSIKGADDAESKIAEGLGIAAEKLTSMKQKGMELHKTYIEPIMQQAFTNKTPPNREQMDAAFASMEAAMIDYAKNTLGLSEQQISDLQSMKNKQMETKMGQESSLKNDASFGEAKLKMMGDKMVSMFLGQWGAANTLATIAPTGKVKFSVSNEATYLAFVASQESIKARLLTMMGTTGTDPMTIGNYLRTAFFDQFVFPPGDAPKPQPPGTGASSAEIEAARVSMEAFMSSYVNTRIMMYFMDVFVSPDDRQTFFSTTQPTMQAVFQTRFSDTANTSGYYMGPDFWATQPSPDTIQTRLTNFNNALTAAIVNDTTSGIMSRAGFDSAQTTTVLNAFRILMAPPDAM